MILTGTTNLPYDLAQRIDQKMTTNFEYQLILELKANGEIYGNIQFENTILNHRLRLKINLEHPVENVLSAIPYGFISKRNQEIIDWKNNYAEFPVNIEPFDKTVSALTDTLGKPDLLYRPGRVSGDITKKGHIMMATPMVQMKDKQVSSSFVLKADKKNTSEKEIAEFRYNLEQESIRYQRQNLNYFIYRIDNKIQKRISDLELKGQEFSLLSFDKNKGVLVSSIHNSYYETGFVIRFENPTSDVVELDIESLFSGYNVKRINAIEEIQEFSRKISPYGVASFLIETN